MSTKRAFWACAGVLALAVMFIAGWVTARTGMGSRIDDASLTDRERAFTEQMRGATLVGYFTVAGREDQPGRPDRYDIASVSKVGEDLWQFNARMRHDDFDVTLPMTIPLRFVGDTPMVMMTDYSLPPLGTFTVRLFFYDDRYAGTWQHGATGGLMYGRIEK
ncbi:MAG: hypothetical protein LC791_13710 [Acidobacteria bacterium]|nr:hypothetical protein [Acidobacteriota bacterium]